MKKRARSIRDATLFVALTVVIYLVGTFVADIELPQTYSELGFNVVAGLVVGAGCYSLTGVVVGRQLRAGGPSERTWYFFGPIVMANYSLSFWLTQRYGAGFAAGVTTATIFRCIQRWQANRNLPKKKSPTALKPPTAGSLGSAIIHIILDLLSIAMATLVLVTGAHLVTALGPAFEGWTATLPGGQSSIGGHRVLATSAVQMVGLLYGAIVTTGYLQALAVGMGDLGFQRTGKYFWACVPYVICLVWSMWQPGLWLGCVSALVVLIAMWAFTNSPPEVALSKPKAALHLFQAHFPKRSNEPRANMESPGTENSEKTAD